VQARRTLLLERRGHHSTPEEETLLISLTRGEKYDRRFFRDVVERGGGEKEKVIARLRNLSYSLEERGGRERI